MDVINIDLTAPAISGSASPQPNRNGWSIGPVTVTWTSADALSGVDWVTAPETLTEDVKAQSVTGTGADRAGNTASATETINIERTAPTIRGSPSPAPNGNGWNNGAVTGTWTRIGHRQGRRLRSGFRNYTVTYGAAFGGFAQPINADGLSRFKLGSTIPVKFQLTCNGSPISTAVAKLYVSNADLNPDAGIDEAISTSAATSGNLFRFSDSQYIFNLSTKAGYTNPGSSTATAFSAGSWRLTVGLDDGSTRSINVQIVK